MLIIVSNTMYSVPLFCIQMLDEETFLFFTKSTVLKKEKKSSIQKLKHALTGEIRIRNSWVLTPCLKVYADHETWGRLFKASLA